MTRYAAASGASLILAGLAGLWLLVLPNPSAADDVRLWLGFGAAGFLLSGIGLEVLRPGPIAPPQRYVQIHLATMALGLLLLSVPLVGWLTVLHRVGWLSLLVAAGDYAYLAWWRPPMAGRMPDPMQEYLAPGIRPRPADSGRDAVARAMFAAAPAYLFLVGVAGAASGSVFTTSTEVLVLLGWLGSAALGTALYAWPRLLGQGALSLHLARWGAILWHLGLVLSVIAVHYWLLAVTGLGGLLLLADLLPTLRGLTRPRPYVVGSRRRYPAVGARLGLAVSLLLLLPLAGATLLPQGGMLWARSLAIAWAAASSLTLLHHLRPTFGRQLMPARGGYTPFLLALASLGIPWQPRIFGALVLLFSTYLAVNWLPGLSLRAPVKEPSRRRRPVG